MKTFKKIIICTLCWAGVAGFAIYETYSIIEKEYARQSEIAAEARKKVNFNLDMIKISVMTEDVETYEKNLTSIKDQMNIISPLSLVKFEQAEYLNILGEYVELLTDKTVLLNEIRSAKTDIVTIKDKMDEQYCNVDNLSREKLKEAKDTVLSYKLIASDYTMEKILVVINKVNEVLDGVSDKAAALADCIDTCYENRINEIDDELADFLKGFADVVDGLNAELEKEFDFDKMNKIKEMDSPE